MTSNQTPPRIHVLAKPTGAICNLDCSYCFFLDKEALYPGSRFRMSDEVLESYIRQLIESHRTDKVTVAWQGGEPTLMGINFFRRAIACQEKYKKPGTCRSWPRRTQNWRWPLPKRAATSPVPVEVALRSRIVMAGRNPGKAEAAPNHVMNHRR